MPKDLLSIYVVASLIVIIGCSGATTHQDADTVIG